MSNLNAQHTKTTWSSIFLRKGGSGRNTKLFEEFESETQRDIVKQAGLRSEELPVIAHVCADGEGFLLTTERLFVMNDGHVQVLETSEINEVSPADFAQVGKSEMSVLEITTADRHGVRLHAESGPPFIGIWNVLRNVMLRNVDYPH